MEVFNKIQNNLDILSEITIEDMFPKDIYYPNQKRVEEMETSAAENEENILNSANYFSENISSSKFSNINKINFSNIPEENTNELESDMNYFSKPIENKHKSKLNKKRKFEKHIKNFKKMTFSNLSEIWDIVLDNEIVAFCGKNYIKVFFFKSALNKCKNASKFHSTPISESQTENININEIPESQKSFNINDINNINQNPNYLNKNLTVENLHTNLNPNIGCNLKSTEINNIKNDNNDYNPSKNSNRSENDLFEEEITFADKNEEFYCMAQSIITIEEETRKILAVGGTKSIIKILDLIAKKEYISLIGHRNEIYALQFHPKQTNILLSASKDYSVRIWNVKNGLQIAILAGPKGHSAEVLAVDWHLSGDYFVSSSIDNTVKIWEISNEIKAKMEQSNQIDLEINKSNMKQISSVGNAEKSEMEQPSDNNDEVKNINFNINYQNNFEPNSNNFEDRSNLSIKNHPARKTKNKFKTLITTIPMFSCKTIHENYVDSVKFNGNFILSKSVDGVVKEWLPIFNKESDYHTIINCYNYDIKELVWYMKLGFDPDSKIFATGNTQGKLFIFKLNEDYENENIDDDFDYYFNNNCHQVIDTGVNKLIRSVAVYENKIVFGNCDSCVFFTEVNLD